MSRTNHKQRAERRGNKEYWKSRLHKNGEEPGRFTKLATHKLERRLARAEIRGILAGLDEVQTSKPCNITRQMQEAAHHQGNTVEAHNSPVNQRSASTETLGAA